MDVIPSARDNRPMSILDRTGQPYLIPNDPCTEVSLAYVACQASCEFQPIIGFGGMGTIVKDSSTRAGGCDGQEGG
jgi:hypothetical protein